VDFCLDLHGAGDSRSGLFRPGSSLTAVTQGEMTSIESNELDEDEVEFLDEKIIETAQTSKPDLDKKESKEDTTPKDDLEKPKMEESDQLQVPEIVKQLKEEEKQGVPEETIIKTIPTPSTDLDQKDESIDKKAVDLAKEHHFLKEKKEKYKPKEEKKNKKDLNEAPPIPKDLVDKIKKEHEKHLKFSEMTSIDSNKIGVNEEKFLEEKILKNSQTPTEDLDKKEDSGEIKATDLAKEHHFFEQKKKQAEAKDKKEDIKTCEL